MNESRFWILASKKLAVDISPEELAELELLFIQQPKYRELLRNFENLPNTKSYGPIEPDEEILLNLRNKIATFDPSFTEQNPCPELLLANDSKNKRKRMLRSVSIILAGIAFIIIYVTYHNNLQPPTSLPSENKVATKPGSRSQVKLPDGTLVTLNADSKLTYPDNFIGDTREVTLEGEAFFEVTENKTRPFIIHSKAMDIKVLGTVFNVKAYPAESISEASLIRGSIEVTLKGRRNEKIMLKPNEKIAVSASVENETSTGSEAAKSLQTRPIHNEPLITLAHLDVDKKENIIKEIGWTQNRLMFKNESLESIAVTLGRWYGQSISIRSERLKTQMFTGNFHDENLSQVLQAFQASSKFNFKSENNAVIIY